jgi:hypothetical protein
MAHEFLNRESEVRLPELSVIYNVKEHDGRLIVTHAGICFATGSNPSSAIVLDWPLPREGELSDVEWQDYRGSPLAIPEDGIVVGWIRTGEAENPPERAVVYDVARGILGTTIRIYSGAPDPRLYRAYPSRGYDAKGCFRGSCVGFVEECFEQAPVDLVLDRFEIEVEGAKIERETEMPDWPLEELWRIAPLVFPEDFMRLFPDYPEYNERRFKAGLWKIGVRSPDYRIFMPGYQLRAFVECRYPFTPSSRMEAFFEPSRPGDL